MRLSCPRPHLMVDRDAYLKLVGESTPVVQKQMLLTHLAAGKSVLDIGCIDHSADAALSLDISWPHGRLRNVATEVVGVDILAEDAARLNGLGYDIRVGDAEAFDLGRTFDLVIAGDIIEHLGRPADLLETMARHMHADSLGVITTPNPFNIEQTIWAAIGKKIMVNDEHTIWLDPRVAHELVSRSPLKVVDFYWIDTRFAFPLAGRGLVPRMVNLISRELMERRALLRRDFALVVAPSDR